MDEFKWVDQESPCKDILALKVTEFRDYVAEVWSLRGQRKIAYKIIGPGDYFVSVFGAPRNIQEGMTWCENIITERIAWVGREERFDRAATRLQNQIGLDLSLVLTHADARVLLAGIKRLQERLNKLCDFTGFSPQELNDDKPLHW
jgi:hypothetical protein